MQVIDSTSHNYMPYSNKYLMFPGCDIPIWVYIILIQAPVSRRFVYEILAQLQIWSTLDCTNGEEPVTGSCPSMREWVGGWLFRFASCTQLDYTLDLALVVCVNSCHWDWLARTHQCNIALLLKVARATHAPNNCGRSAFHALSWLTLFNRDIKDNLTNLINLTCLWAHYCETDSAAL